MEESVTRGLFNLDSLNEASKGKVKNIEVYLLKENRLNGLYSQEDIELLKDNIEEFQLSQPLVVKKNSDGSYTILSGHRRFKACKKIFEEGKHLYFFDKEFVDQIPYIVDNRQFKNEDDEFLAIVSSNASRVLSVDERKKIYLKLKEIYDHKCASGERPKGKEREVIAAWMGVSDRTVQTYKTKTLPDKVQKQNKKETDKKNAIIKRFSIIQKELTSFEPDHYSIEEINDIRELAIQSIRTTLQQLEIGIDHL